MPDSPEQNASTMTQPATADANGTSETHADDTSLRLVDSPAQEASSLTNGHPPELHSAPESIAEEEESVEDEDEEDEEPVLKYEKMGGIVNEILEKDTASAIAVSSKLVVCYFKTDLDVTLLNPLNPQALGTHNGITHVMDFAGNRVKSYRSHKASINDIRIDASSEFVATASMDGPHS